MKHSLLYTIAISIFISCSAFTAKAESGILNHPMSLVSDSTLAVADNARLLEIKAMDKSNLSSSEKKALRKEVRSIKGHSYYARGGIYLSVGAILIIVLLLVLLL
jgi:hypothetical protein